MLRILITDLLYLMKNKTPVYQQTSFNKNMKNFSRSIRKLLHIQKKKKYFENLTKVLMLLKLNVTYSYVIKLY